MATPNRNFRPGEPLASRVDALCQRRGCDLSALIRAALARELIAADAASPVELLSPEDRDILVATRSLRDASPRGAYALLRIVERLLRSPRGQISIESALSWIASAPTTEEDDEQPRPRRRTARGT